MNLEENEVAKPIEGYEETHIITSFGRVWSVKYKRYLGMYPIKNGGYLRVALSKNKKPNNYLVHRLVAINFIENPKPSEYDMIDHINHNRTDNNIINLRWCNRELNGRNQIKQQNTSSRYKGVCYRKNRNATNKWETKITINKICKSLGSYFTEEEAANAYNQYIIDNKLEEFFILNDI